MGWLSLASGWCWWRPVLGPRPHRALTDRCADYVRTIDTANEMRIETNPGPSRLVMRAPLPPLPDDTAQTIRLVFLAAQLTIATHDDYDTQFFRRKSWNGDLS